MPSRNPRDSETSEYALLWNELATCARAVRERSDALDTLSVLGQALDRVIGSRMLSFLRFDYAQRDMVRMFCTRPSDYPMGARKPMRGGRWSECVIDRGSAFIASGEAEMRATFTDHAALARLGCRSTLCVPVRHAGCTLGTMNLNGEEGRYGEREAELAQLFATLAVPVFMTAHDRG